MNRNELVHAVIWPSAKKAVIALLDTDGVVQSEIGIDSPMKGSELSKMIPDGYSVDLDKCHVVSMAGEVLVNTVAEFDTAVVTERPEVSFEDRLANMERRERRREKRAAKREAELMAATEELAALRAQQDAQAVVESDPQDPPQDPQDPPADPPQDPQDPPNEGGEE